VHNLVLLLEIQKEIAKEVKSEKLKVLNTFTAITQKTQQIGI